MNGFEQREMGFKVSATIYPVNHDFPVADSNDIAGNMMFVDEEIDLLSIPQSKRKLGMFAFVNNEGSH